MRLDDYYFRGYTKGMSTIATGEELLTVPEAALVKGISENSIRIAIRGGRLPAEKRGPIWMIRLRDLWDWKARRKRNHANPG